MKNTVIIRMSIENIPVEIEVVRNCDYHHLKEVLRDTLSPQLSNKKQNWGRIVEIIRDNVGPHFG